MKRPYYRCFKRGNKAGTRYYFTLHAANGEAICQSEGYTSKEMRDKGISSLRRNALIARVIDI